MEKREQIQTWGRKGLFLPEDGTGTGEHDRPLRQAGEQEEHVIPHSMHLSLLFKFDLYLSLFLSCGRRPILLISKQELKC